MKFPEEYKRRWWYLAIIISGILLIYRLDAISSGTATNFDTGLLATITALWFLPFFSEFSFLGLAFKQQIEQAKKETEQNIKEVKQDIREAKISIRNELQNMIQMSASQQINFYGQAREDEEIREFKPIMFNSLNNELDELGVSTEYINDNNNETANIPEIPQLCFNSRYSIEKSLKELWEAKLTEEPPRRLSQITNKLLYKKIIPYSLHELIKEVSAIANLGIHGEYVTQEKANFLREATPKILNSIKAIRDKTQ